MEEKAKGKTSTAIRKLMGLQPRTARVVKDGREEMTMFHISVDEYFYPQEKAEKSTIRRQIDVSLDELTDEELKIIQGTIDGIMKYKGTGSK